jgi:hypothetical protein
MHISSRRRAAFYSIPLINTMKTSHLYQLIDSAMSSGLITAFTAIFTPRAGAKHERRERRLSITTWVLPFDYDTTIKSV